MGSWSNGGKAKKRFRSTRLQTEATDRANPPGIPVPAPTTGFHLSRQRDPITRPVLIGIPLFFLLLLSCGTSREDPAAGLVAFVSIPPQEYFVERIAGERVETHTLVGAGQSPHTYSPTPSQMARLAEARVFFRIGVEFEESLIPKLRSAVPGLRIVDLRRGVALRSVEEEGHEHHDHGDEGKDPHIWLSPILVKKLSQTIRDELIELDSAGAATYRRNYTAFAGDLDSIHAELQRALHPVKGKEFFVFHGAFGYFAHTYGLRQVAVEMGGKKPGARRLAGLIEKAKRRNIRVIFVQPQFSSASAQAIAEEIDGAVVRIDPLARDYLANLRTLARSVAEGLAMQQ